MFQIEVCFVQQSNSMWNNVVNEVEELGVEVASAVKHEVVAIEKDLVAVERKVESVAGIPSGTSRGTFRHNHSCKNNSRVEYFCVTFDHKLTL